MLVLCSAESHHPLRMTLEHSMLAAAHTALADRFDTPSGSQSSLAVIPVFLRNYSVMSTTSKPKCWAGTNKVDE